MTTNGIMLSSNALGTGLAPLVGASAILAFGWHNAFFLVAGAGVIVAIGAGLLLPRRLRGQATDDQVSHSTVSTGKLSRTPVLWRFALLFCGFDIVNYGLTSWVPTYFIEQRHVTLLTTGFYAAIPWFVATASTIVGGILFDRFFHRNPRFLIIPAMAVTAVFLWLMIHAGSPEGFVVFESLGMACMWLCFMPTFGIPIRNLPSELTASANGVINFGGQAAGAITPVIMGVLADQFSFTLAFLFLILGALIALGAALWIPQSGQAFRDAVMRSVSNPQQS